jgi:uncharacterized protein (UPF0147 family)
VPEDFKIECSEKLGTSERSTGVAALNEIYHTNNIPAYLRTDLLEVLKVGHNAKGLNKNIEGNL